jgi:uncharacterized alpha-E superfamily protein
LLRSALLRFDPERAGDALPELAPLLHTLHAQGQLTGLTLQGAQAGTHALPGGQLTGLAEKRELRQNPEAFEAELLAIIFDAARVGSLRHTVDHLFRLEVHVRDRTSNDMWCVISKLNDRLAAPAPHPITLAGDAVRLLTETLESLAAVHGLVRENMTRAQAWRFLDIGLRIERAIYLCTLLASTLDSPEAGNPSVLETVLELADSSITYRSRYSLLPHLAAVFDLVLLDDKNPRSVLFQLDQLAQHLEQLPRDNPSALGPGQALLLKSIERLRGTDARELAGTKTDWHSTTVGQIIRQTLLDLPTLSDVITAGYFAHSALSRTGRDHTP